MNRVSVLLGSLVLAVATLVGTAGAAPGPGASPEHRRTIATADDCADVEELAFLELINDYRHQNGKPALALTRTLSDASRHHSVSMANHNYFSHDLTPEAVTWSQNMIDHGYAYDTYLGENIAAGYATAFDTFLQWQNSPSHNANMLNGNFTAIGIGRAFGSDSTYGWYWTTVFGGVVDAAACGAPAPPPGEMPDEAQTPGEAQAV